MCGILPGNNSTCLTTLRASCPTKKESKKEINMYDPCWSYFLNFGQNMSNSDNQVVISDTFFRKFGNDKGYHVIASNVLGFLSHLDIILIAVKDPVFGLSLLGSYNGGASLTDIRFPGNLTEQVRN